MSWEQIPQEAGEGSFGTATGQEVSDLNKALSAGYNRPVSTGGGALRVESLESTLKIITFSQKNIKLWKAMSKLNADSTVVEWNQLSSYGDDAGGFVSEGALPETADSEYTRKTSQVKFIGTTREVTHPMTMVTPAHGPVVALETQNGGIWMLERIESALFKGRSDIVTEEFDGLFKQILDADGVTNPWTASPVTNKASPLVFDLRGGDLTEDIIEEASQRIADDYGVATKLYASTKAISNLTKSFYPRERVNLPSPVNGQVGMAVTSMLTNNGPIAFEPDVFLRGGRRNGSTTPLSAASSTKAPTAPTFAAGAPASDALSKFVSSDAGVYGYKISAINKYGESLPSAGANVTLAAGEKVAITITDGGGTYGAVGYRIYRTDKGGSVYNLITTIPRGAGPAATTVFTDYNFWLPGCSQAAMIQEDLNYFSFRQLTPLIKIPLATIAASIRWMMLLYGTPVVYAPAKSRMFINVRDR